MYKTVTFEQIFTCNVILNIIKTFSECMSKFIHEYTQSRIEFSFHFSKTSNLVP